MIPKMTIKEEVDMVSEVLARLTRKQVEILELLPRYSKTLEIARVANLHRQTVKNHLRSIACRLGVHNRIDLAQIGEKLTFYKESPWMVIERSN